MREIKVRGKRIDNGNWTYGFYVLREDESPVGETWETYNQHLICTYDFQGLTEYEVDIETVGQYTGIEDNNDVEIYEGDIVKNLNHIKSLTRVGVIVFSEGSFRVDFLIDESPQVIDRFDLEVIGNVYDNSELLK